MIEARGITKRYGDFVAVDDVSFEAEAGEVIGGVETFHGMHLGEVEGRAGKRVFSWDDYIGNSRADLPVWEANAAMNVPSGQPSDFSAAVTT